MNEDEQTPDIVIASFLMNARLTGFLLLYVSETEVELCHETP